MMVDVYVRIRIEILTISVIKHQSFSFPIFFFWSSNQQEKGIRTKDVRTPLNQHLVGLWSLYNVLDGK